MYKYFRLTQNDKWINTIVFGIVAQENSKNKD